MSSTEPLISEHYYHIYNRGINSCNLFAEPANYEYFLALYDKHITPVADTYAYILMPNHFHLLVHINLTGLSPDYQSNLSGLEKIKQPHQHFSNLFNAYSKAFNKRYNRHGSLFERPFKRKLIDSEEYLKQVIIYIHNNPVHHGFCSHALEYPWSSYLTCLSEKPSKLKRDAVLEWFGDKENFKYCHHSSLNTDELENYLQI